MKYPGTDEPPIKIGNTIWAPVNCGYDSIHPYGLLYQWNRKDGGGYDDTEGMQEYSEEDVPATPVATKFYKKWAQKEWSTKNDPCPSDWRVPTYEEMENLCNAGSKWTTGGRLFGTSPNQLFIPAAGYHIYTNENPYARGEGADYMTSYSDGSDPWSLQFNNENVGMYNGKFADGFSVRCVKVQ